MDCYGTLNSVLKSYLLGLRHIFLGTFYVLLWIIRDICKKAMYLYDVFWSIWVKKFMHYTNFSNVLGSVLSVKIISLSLVLACSVTLGGVAFAQSEEFSSAETLSQFDALPDDTAAADAFSFDDDGFGFEKTAEELESSFRKKAFDQALKTLLPLKPEEIRTVLEHFDRTVESTELPVHPYPRAESVVQNVSLDPGVPPLTLHLAYGYVTTLSILDATGAPWPIEDISWVGDFTVEESSVDTTTHILRISPQTKFAHGNVSMRLVDLDAPVIMTFGTGRDIVHYRFDAIIPKRGPSAKMPLISHGVTLAAGDKNMAVALSGVVPRDAKSLDVSGVDGHTTAYMYNGMTYVRTPLTLLSPGWNSSVASADGTKIYALDETPVILLSDRGRMVRARLTAHEDLLDE